VILHLAGRLTGSEDEIRRDNEGAARGLFAAAQACDSRPRIVLASSAAVYGVGGSREKPIDEDVPPAPRGLYAETKLEGELAARPYMDAGGEAIIARITNPVGPGMGDHLLCGTVARQIVAIERGAQPPLLQLRDLSPWRDFIHVADVAEGLWRLATKGEPGEIYNVAAGTCVQVREVVDAFLERARVRSIEVKSTVASNQRSPLHEQWLSRDKLSGLGWNPTRSVARAVEDLLEAQRAESGVRGAR
jgi:GDP-4-dehydro-6-deoxy-D-mannose reductase